MSFTIAITGKGGVGKTTVAGLLVSRLIGRGCSPVLAVDADPNTCLDEVLGVKVSSTVGGVREEARQAAAKGLAAGVSRQQLLEMRIAESLVEADEFDLIAMGRPEGPGCYCYANNVLKDVILKLSRNYPYVVIDNEAGLENLSRRIVQAVNLLVMVTDPSRKGRQTVGRLHQLAREMDVRYERLAIIVNRLPDGSLPRGADELSARTGAEFIIGLPEDAELLDASQRGESLLHLPATNAVARKMEELLTAVCPVPAARKTLVPPGRS